MSDLNKYPKGWDAERVGRLADRYDEQTEEQALAEDEAAFEDDEQAFIEVPRELVPEVRRLISRHAAG